MKQSSRPGALYRLLNFLPWLIVLLGVSLRIILFVQNRDLIIDEANIARNLHERGFMELLRPLSYYQYAPPVFLWMEELSSLLFGYGEKALRLFPLLCGIASLFVLRRLLALLMPARVYWLPLLYFACGIIYVKYSAEVKQYVPDALVALLLLWLALRMDITSSRRGRFIRVWMLAGSLAIWSSMPSVFILAGIGAYYLYAIVQLGHAGFLPRLLLPAGLWLVQFGLYYALILHHQIGSEYLQNFHAPYFLHPLPASGAEWAHNGERLLAVLGAIGGYTTIAVVLNLLLLGAGCYWLLRQKHSSWLILFGLPVLLVLIAAALQQFSLIERVILFIMPLVLVLMGFGYHALSRLWKPLLLVLGMAGLVAVGGYQMVFLLWDRYEFYDLTRGLDYLQRQGARGAQLLVHDATADSYTYYTSLHPEHARWAKLRGAALPAWNDDYSQMVRTDTVYVLITGISEEDKARRRQQLESARLQPAGGFEARSREGRGLCYVWRYVRMP